MIIKLGEAAGSLLSSLAAAGAEEPQAKVTLGCPLQPAGACSPVSSPLPQPRAPLTHTRIPFFLPHCQLSSPTGLLCTCLPSPQLSRRSTGQSQGPRIRNQGTPQERPPFLPSQSRPPRKAPDLLSRLTTHAGHSHGTSHTPQ